MTDDVLQPILAEMRQIVADTSIDEVQAHIRADALLVDAIRALAPDDETARELLAVYDNISKWYE